MDWVQNKLTSRILIVLLVVFGCSCTTSKLAATNSAEKDAVYKYAEQLHANPKTMNGRIYLLVDQWIGTPYRRGGTTKQGVDCSGFVMQFEKQATGIALPHSAASTYKQLNTQTVIHQPNSLDEGDLIFFKRKGRIFHIGIYLTNGNFVHASTSRGVIISRINDGYWKKYFYKGKRL